MPLAVEGKFPDQYIQQILDRVLKGGHYDPFMVRKSFDPLNVQHTYPNMCFAIIAGNKYDSISCSERMISLDAIKNYIEELGSQLPPDYPKTSAMNVLLSDLGLPHSPQDLIDLYTNWTGRKRFSE